GLPAEVRWTSSIPGDVTGLVIANEWLDDVPLDAVDHRAALTGRDAEWAQEWWPGGGIVEIGWPRDDAWAGLVGSLRRGLAVGVDYGHVRGDRPAGGTVAAYRDGRSVVP